MIHNEEKKKEVEEMAQLGTRSVPWKVSIVPQLVALVGVAGPILCVLVFTLAGFLRPGYSPIHQAISDLGVGPNAWILNTDLVISGLLFITFAIGFYWRMRPLISGRWLLASTILLALSGAGVVNEGFFHEPPQGDPAARLHIVIHAIGLSVLFYSLIVALLITGWRLCKNPAWRRYGWYSLFTALVTYGLLVVPGHFAGFGQIAGLIERVQVVVAFAWSVVMGCRLFILERACQDGYE
jgi:hypothetical membrane protein